MGRKLYVGNLPYSSTEDSLREAFSQSGTVDSVTIIIDRDTGRSKGFGFVEMSTDAEAQAAIEALDGQDFGGRRVKVNEAKPDGDEPVLGDFPLRVHRGAVVAMLTLAIADAETLASAAVNHDEPGTLSYALLDVGAAGIMLVGIVGLYRLRGWGLLLTLACNVLVAAAAWAGVLIYDPGFAALLTATALVQLSLGVPLLRTLLRGDVPLRAGRRSAPWVARTVVVACVVASGLGAVHFANPSTLAPICAEE